MSKYSSPCRRLKPAHGLPRVSVLMPLYNAAATVEDAAADILEQRGVTVELIVVDDGSTDGGPAKLARRFGGDPRLRIVRALTSGIAAALETARAMARSPWIARMDADDRCAQERLARQIDALRSSRRLAAVGTRVDPFPEDAVKEGWAQYCAWQNGLTTPRDHRRELFVESPLCHPSVALRARALATVGGWRQVPWPEDYDLWLRLDAFGWDLAKIPETLYKWRRHRDQATNRDARYSREAFRQAKAGPLAQRLRGTGRPFAIWGAGAGGKRLARALEAFGVAPMAFVDVDPRKLGGTARGRLVVEATELDRREHFVLAAVGNRGAREEIRRYLSRRGFREEIDFLCAA